MKRFNQFFINKLSQYQTPRVLIANDNQCNTIKSLIRLPNIHLSVTSSVIDLKSKISLMKNGYASTSWDNILCESKPRNNQKPYDIIVYFSRDYSSYSRIEFELQELSTLFKKDTSLLFVTHKRKGFSYFVKKFNKVFSEIPIEVHRLNKGIIVLSCKVSKSVDFDTPSKKLIQVEFRNEYFNFYTEKGLFSNDKLDPGTKLLLETVTPFISNHSKPSTKLILDMCCGWGPIGIILAKLIPNSKFTLVDVDCRAVSLAETNTRKNSVDSLCNCVATDSIVSDLDKNKFDFIVSNPPFHLDRNKLKNIFTATKQKLTDQGKFYIVVEDTHKKSIYHILASIYRYVNEIDSNEIYSILEMHS